MVEESEGKREENSNDLRFSYGEIQKDHEGTMMHREKF